MFKKEIRWEKQTKNGEDGERDKEAETQGYNSKPSFWRWHYSKDLKEQRWQRTVCDKKVSSKQKINTKGLRQKCVGLFSSSLKPIPVVLVIHSLNLHYTWIFLGALCTVETLLLSIFKKLTLIDYSKKKKSGGARYLSQQLQPMWAAYPSSTPNVHFPLMPIQGKSRE